MEQKHPETTEGENVAHQQQPPSKLLYSTENLVVKNFHSTLKIDLILETELFP